MFILNQPLEIPYVISTLSSAMSAAETVFRLTVSNVCEGEPEEPFCGDDSSFGITTERRSDPSRLPERPGAPAGRRRP
jgi:hypothetical protein